MTIKRIGVFSVPVSNQDAAKTFYTEKLGFEVLGDNPMGPNQRWIQVGPAGAETSITLVTWFPNMPAGSVSGIVLETDDVEAAVAELQAKGVATTPIESQGWGRFSTFQDPDGNGWVLQERAAY